MTQFLIGFAQAAPAAGGGGPFGAFGGIVPMIAIFAIMYFLVLRPQSRKAKELQKMISELKKGDEVITTGGIVGKITGMTDGELTLQVQEGVRLKVLRSAIQGRYTPPSAQPKADAKAS